MIMTMLMMTMPMMTMMTTTMMGKCRWHRGKGWNNSATRNLGQGRTQPAAAGAGNMWSSGSPSSLTLRFCAKVSWATKWWQNNHLKMFLSDCHMRLRRGAISCHIWFFCCQVWGGLCWSDFSAYSDIGHGAKDGCPVSHNTLLCIFYSVPLLIWNLTACIRWVSVHKPWWFLPYIYVQGRKENQCRSTVRQVPRLTWKLHFQKQVTRLQSDWNLGIKASIHESFASH